MHGENKGYASPLLSMYFDRTRTVKSFSLTPQPLLLMYFDKFRSWNVFGIR